MSRNEIEFGGMKKALSKLGRKTAALVKIQKEGNCANPGGPDYSHGCKLLNRAMSGGKRKKRKKTRRKKRRKKRRKTRIKRRKKRTNKKARKQRRKTMSKNGRASTKKLNINHKKIVGKNSSQNNVPSPVLQPTNQGMQIGQEVSLTDTDEPFNIGIIRSIDFPHYTIEMQYPSDEGEIIVTANDIVITA